MNIRIQIALGLCLLLAGGAYISGQGGTPQPSKLDIVKVNRGLLHKPQQITRIDWPTITNRFEIVVIGLVACVPVCISGQSHGFLKRMNDGWIEGVLFATFFEFVVTKMWKLMVAVNPCRPMTSRRFFAKTGKTSLPFDDGRTTQTSLYKR